MSIKTWLSHAVSTALAPGLDDIVSTEKKELRGLRIAQRFSRGNTNVQHGRTATEQQQRSRIDVYIARSKRGDFFFQK